MEKREWIFVVVVLVMQLLLLSSLAAQDSQTIDEAVHLASGVSYLAAGDFTLNPEHPPFVKLLAGSSALLAGPRVPFDDPSWAAADEWDFGRAFLYGNRVSADVLLFLGRIPAMLLAAILTLAVFLFARVLLGRKAGYLALLLLVLAPNLLAHGHYITTDVPFTLFFFLSIAYFWWAFHTRSRLAVLVAAVFLGLAHITKFSALTMWPILLVLGFLAVLHDPAWRRALRLFFLYLLSGIAVTAVLILLVYGFTTHPASADPAVAQALAVSAFDPAGASPLARLTMDENGVRPAFRFLAEHVPIPALDFFRGVDNVWSHNYFGHDAYLLGQTATHGWWWYFPAAFFFKFPAAASVLFVLGLVGLVRVALRRLHRRGVLAWYRGLPLSAILFFTAPLLFLFISLGSHINLGVRHLFPVFPFAYLLCTVPFLLRGKRFQRLLEKTLWSVLLVFVFSIGVASPYFTSYFSEFVGGWKHGPDYLLDSNYDWGQDLKRLRTRLAAHDLPEPIAFYYYGSADVVRYLGRGFAGLPTDEEVRQDGLPQLGTVLVSAGAYYDRNRDRTWLNALPVREVIGTTIFVLDGGLRKNFQ